MIPSKRFLQAGPRARSAVLDTIKSGVRLRGAALTAAAWLGASCAHVMGEKATAEEVKQYATVEDFIDDNFVVGVQAFSDLMPTGKPDWIIDKGFVRYRVPTCQGDLSYVQKPSADLATYCAAKGGTFATHAVDAWGTAAFAGRGYVGTYACSVGGAVQWQACVRVENVEPDQSCSNVTFLIHGSSTSQGSAPLCDAAAR